MKAIKYLVMGVLLTGFSATAMAQEEEAKAAIAAIKSNAADKAELVKIAQKKNKKNAENLVKIGRTFFEANDTAEARRFANLADAAAKHKCAPAFILMGDIEAIGNEGGKAAGFYNQATFADPKDPTGYYKYALVYRKISPRGAVQKLQDLHAQRPDIEVNEMIGRIYSLSLKYNDAIEAWKTVPVQKMERANIVEYALANYFLGKHEDGLRVAKEGLQKFPRHGALNRLAMMFNYELKNYEEAQKFGDALFNRTDSAKFSNVDYFYYGLTHDALKNYDRAIEEYNKAINDTASSSLIKKENIIRKLSDAYAAKEDYVNAIAQYEEFLKVAEKPSANDYAGLGTLYMQQATGKQGAERDEIFKKADQVYSDLAQKYENASEYATLMRARVNAQMDPKSEKGLAKPFYEQLISTISPKAEKDNSDVARLKEAYSYMISYAFLVKNDKATARDYATKLQVIDPDNEIAKQVLSMK